ncbi:regulator of G-protein signaling 21 [Ictalurus punctatus]|uniref:Regulator of G-protein signaling 1 n=1 Tax=Ictalurus punctatus TaxID=7998 RepID=A0A9F7THV2_ICTPU|nr:regulator of G-protein signaling 21 [Ictalurus punctatus]
MFISMSSIHGGSPAQTPSAVPYTGRVRGKQILSTGVAKMAIKFCCFAKEPVEDVTVWSESIEKLLESQAGLHAFTEFLKSEYSEENILFWHACVEYKKISCRTERMCEANRIYSEFVQTEAPRQINIDCKTRATITKNISEPDEATFETAQALIYRLMTRDSYPRFLKSDIYQALLQK